jgi:hypothetical protein
MGSLRHDCVRSALGFAIQLLAVVVWPSRGALGDPEPPAAPSEPLIPVTPAPRPSAAEEAIALPPRDLAPTLEARAATTPPFSAALTLGLGLNVVLARGGIGPVADLSLAAALHPVARWSFGVVANLPVASASVGAPPDGSASVSATTLGGELAYALGRDSWLFHPDVAVGAAAVLLRLDGTAAQASRSASTDVWMAAPLVRGGLAFALTSDWRLRADATLGFTIPEGVVDLAGHPIGTWGRPMFAGGASLEAWLR